MLTVSRGWRGGPILLLLVAAGAARAADVDLTIVRVTASRNPRVHHMLLTLDGDTSRGWSVQGDGHWICYELNRPARLEHISLAWAAGDERVYRFDVLTSRDGREWTTVFTGASSGKTSDLQTHRFEPVEARFVKIVGHGSNQNQWVNLMEARIDSADYSWPDPEMDRFDPPREAEDAEPFIYAVSARPSPRDTLPHNAFDGDPGTGWSAQEDGQWLTAHLSRLAKIDTVAVTWACAHNVPFAARVSVDGSTWTSAHEGTSGGEAGAPEAHRFEPTPTRYVRFVVKGSTPQHWHRISELRIGDLPYRPTPQARWWTHRWESGPPSEAYLEAYSRAERRPYGDMARTCLATIIEKGTDRYGSVHAPIWVLNLDLDTLDCFPRYNDALIEKAAGATTYSSTAPYGIGHRAIRGSQRESGCANLYVDQPMIRAALLNGALTGDEMFTPPVDAYVRWCFDNLMDEDTGLLEWGVHTSYDVYEDRLKHGDGYQHEVMCILPMWPLLERVEPERAPAYMEKLWYWHTDPQTGIVDRHATRGKGLDFAMAAGEVVLACALLHTQEPDGPWLDRALRVAHAHWDTRDPDTDLFVNTPHGGTGKRFDNLYSDTTVTGYWANRVLIAGRITECDELTEMARRTLAAWAKYGWDDAADLPWASLRPDGTPNTKPRDYEATTYDKFDPSGHWDLWKDYVYGFEAPFATLMTYAAAAQWLDDPGLQAHATRLADCYRRHLPANDRLGTFAANYGQLISFFLAMERVSGDPAHRDAARRVADEAVRRLWTGRMLRGFAGRTHYTAIEGAGYLVQALLELEADPSRLAAAHQDPFLWNF